MEYPTVQEYLDALSSSRSAPGGGSAAALTAALAASLNAMVAAISSRKKPELANLADKSRDIRDRLVFLIDEDTRAFLDLMSAYKAKDEPQIAVRAEYAAAVPLQIAEKALESMVLGLELMEKGSRSVFTDAYAAVLLGWAGAQAALLNTYINLSSLPDSPKKKETIAKAEAYRAKADDLVRQSEPGGADFYRRCFTPP